MREWSQAVYNKQLRVASKLTDKGILEALRDRWSLAPEAFEAYKDVLRERGWSDTMLRNAEAF